MSGANVGTAIWRIALRPAVEMSVVCDALDRQELDHASRMRNEAEARGWAYAHAAMRHILASRLDVPPSAIGYARDGGVKPRVTVASRPAPHLDFSLSHSGDWAYLAVSDEATVGVDLEKISDSLDYAALLDIVCTPAESQSMLSSPEGERNAQFHRIWVRKESLLKSMGVGLSTEQPLTSIDVLSPVAYLRAFPDQPWFVADVPAPDGYVAALTSSQSTSNITWHEWPCS
jgi:4'-phosphopantetheinyl transferase